jgi:hypothetical protein
MKLHLRTVFRRATPGQPYEARLLLDYIQCSRPGMTGGYCWIVQVLLSWDVDVEYLSIWCLLRRCHLGLASVYGESCQHSNASAGV